MIDSILILAAGRGERLGALTKEKPKPLLEIDSNGTSILDRIVQQCLHEFPDIPVFANISYLAEQFLDYYAFKPVHQIPNFIFEFQALGPAKSLAEFQKLGKKSTLIIHGDLVLSNSGFSKLAEVIKTTKRQFVVCHRRPRVEARSEVKTKEDKIISISENQNKFIQESSSEIVSVCSGIYKIHSSSIVNDIPHIDESLAPHLLNHSVAHEETFKFMWSDWRFAVDSPEIYIQAQKKVLEQL